MPVILVYILYAIGVIVSWIIFYYVVKAAVKNGIKEARGTGSLDRHIEEYKPERAYTQKQITLQQQYDRGEITFEIFQKEWNKL